MKLPDEWKITNDWNSHRPLLYSAVINTLGKVIELGSGFGSTDLLRKICNENFRVFRSYETNIEWADKVGAIVVKSYLQPITDMRQRNEENFGLTFIDCAPGEIRKDLVKEYGKVSRVVVVHDSEKSSSFCYNLEPTLSQFKYRIDFAPIGMPNSTAVSNFIDVSKFEIAE